MGKFNLTEVKTKKEIMQWLDFPAKLYKKDPHYVRPLDNEVENIFDRSKNKLFRKGDATRYISMMKRRQTHTKRKKTANLQEAAAFSIA